MSDNKESPMQSRAENTLLNTRKKRKVTNAMSSNQSSSQNKAGNSKEMSDKNENSKEQPSTSAGSKVSKNNIEAKPQTSANSEVVEKGNKKKPLLEHQNKTITTIKNPPVSEMVDKAIGDQQKKNKGTSLPLIKSYIASTYMVDSQKLAGRIGTYIKKSVENGHIVQVTGKGLSGSFKLKAAKESEKLKKTATGSKTKKTEMIKKTATGSNTRKTATKGNKENEAEEKKMPVKNKKNPIKIMTALNKSAKRRSVVSTKVRRSVAYMRTPPKAKTANVKKAAMLKNVVSKKREN